jgi:DNA-binding MarR family transcriptional regulator
MTVFESEEYEIAMLVRRVSLMMHRARQNELMHLGLTPVQVGVLHFAQNLEEPCTIKQLLKFLYRRNSSMVGIINRMERDGLVQRQVDNRSKKHTQILITKKGAALYRKAINISAFTTIIDSLPKEDMSRMKQYLSTLNNAAEELLGISK